MTAPAGPFEHYVVFVDMLGFAALLEREPLNRNVLESLQRPRDVSAPTFPPPTEDEADANAHSLSDHFVRFHLAIEAATARCRDNEDCSVISFSDSAFFACKSADSAVTFAVGVMHESLANQIPVRMGLAWGDFFVARMKADFGLVSQDHAVQFLGTGISRAHAAESCGAKGLRILVHPSAVPSLSNRALGAFGAAPDRHWYLLIDLHSTEQNNKAKIRQELNYLWPDKDDEPYSGLFEEMRGRAPRKQQRHYKATQAALGRMRSAARFPWGPPSRVAD